MSEPAVMVCTLADLNEVLEAARFLESFAMRAESCAPGECVVRVPYSAGLERPGGVVSGITIMGVADVAVWLAIMTHRGTRENWVTTDLKTAFLNGARASDILCSAKILKMGKRTCYGTAECRDVRGLLLAHHTVSYALVTA